MGTFLHSILIVTTATKQKQLQLRFTLGMVDQLRLEDRGFWHVYCMPTGKLHDT